MLWEEKIVKLYQSMLFTRYDDNGLAYYFSAEDFPGLQKEPLSFTASAGHTLQGYLYRYESPVPGRIVVFDHGIGGGHRSYMKEIEKLCGRGYCVFAYDHTGCMESGGENTGGMAQSLCDLNDCIAALRANPRFADTDISVVGHSWGGYAALNIPALQPEVSHVVALSGFVSVEECVKSFFPGVLGVYRRAVMKLEEEAHPDFVAFNAAKTLSKAKAKALLLYSDNDRKCRKNNYEILHAALQDKKNIRFLLVKGKGHNPNYTTDAVGYLESYIGTLQKKLKCHELETAEEKKSFLASFDWNRMTAQDEAVWNEIFACLEA